MNTLRFTTRDYCMIALCTSVIAVLAQISIPLPVGIPITLQTFAITLTAIILGEKKGTLSALIYILLGAIGFPVFHGFTGGIQAFVRPAAGFLLSFPVMAWHIGHGAGHYRNSKIKFVSGLITGTVLNMIAGTCIFSILTGSSMKISFAACVLPFIPTTIIQVCAAAIVGIKIRQRLLYFT